VTDQHSPIALELAFLRDLGFVDAYRPQRAPKPAPEPHAARPERSPANPRRPGGRPPRRTAHTVDVAPARPDAVRNIAEPVNRSAPDPAPPVDRLERLRSVDREARRCTACRLCETRNSVVFGDGDPNADLMFIGEGPGFQEDRRGLPFVGPAGQLLNRIIRAIDLRRADVYITNVVKCRPPNNRDPQPDESAACRSFLERQIDLVAPRVIVALGRVAAQQLLKTTSPLGRLRGTWHDVRGVPVRVTYHPAYLLRNASAKRPTWEDMQVVRDRLQASSSEPPAAP